MKMKRKSINRLFDDAIDELEITYDVYFEIERLRPRSVHLVDRLLSSGIKKGKVLVYSSNETPFGMLLEKVGFHVEDFSFHKNHDDEKGYGMLKQVPSVEMIDALKSAYDVICCDDILQSLECPAEVLRLLKDHVRPGGLLTISTPNAARGSARLRLLAGKNVYPFPDDHFSREENLQGSILRLPPYREYTLDELEMLVTSIGLELTQSEFIIGKSVNANMWPPMPIKEYLLQKLFLTAQKVVPAFRNYLFVAGRKSVPVEGDGTSGKTS